MRTYEQPKSKAFLGYVDDWYESLLDARLDEVIAQAGGANRVGIFAVDLVKGFCETGPLASQRVGAIVQPIADLLRTAYEKGVRYFVLPQDSHPKQSPQFEQYGPHCVEGTREAQTVDALMALPFSGRFQIMPKHSISAALGTRLDGSLDDYPLLKLALCVGDCTDLCLYQLAMHLKLRSNVQELHTRVLVPANCVDTYHLSVAQAAKLRAMPHDAELLHRLFLYHMALNGIEVVARLT